MTENKMVYSWTESGKIIPKLQNKIIFYVIGTFSKLGFFSHRIHFITCLTGCLSWTILIQTRPQTLMEISRVSHGFLCLLRIVYTLRNNISSWLGLQGLSRKLQVFQKPRFLWKFWKTIPCFALLRFWPFLQTKHLKNCLVHNHCLHSSSQLQQYSNWRSACQAGQLGGTAQRLSRMKQQQKQSTKQPMVLTAVWWWLEMKGLLNTHSSVAVLLL